MRWPIPRTEFMEFSGDHSAQRHMHLEIRGGPLCDFAPTRREPEFPVVPKRSVAFRLSYKSSPNQVIQRSCEATLIFGLPRVRPTWCFVTARNTMWVAP